VDEYEIKEVGTSDVISGYGSVFDVKDSDDDIIRPGTFKRSIGLRGPDSNAKGKIAFLYQHDARDPRGQMIGLMEDSKGLMFETKLDNIPENKRLKSQLKSGTINQFSIGFRYVADKLNYDPAAKAWIIEDVELYEISAVTLGANDQTEFLGFKSKGELIDCRKRIEELLEQEDLANAYELRQLINRIINNNENTEIKSIIEKNTEFNDIKELFSTLKLF